MQSRVEQNCNCYCLAKLLSSENGYGCTLFIQTGNLEGISESVFEGLVEQSTADLCFRKLSQAKLSRAVFFSGSAEQSMVFTVFTGSVELAFRSHCDFEGLVEQSMVFTVFSKA